MHNAVLLLGLALVLAGGEARAQTPVADDLPEAAFYMVGALDLDSLVPQRNARAHDDLQESVARCLWAIGPEFFADASERRGGAVPVNPLKEPINELAVVAFGFSNVAQGSNDLGHHLASPFRLNQVARVIWDLRDWGPFLAE